MGDSRGTRVYVGNLTDKVKKEDLEGEFTKYGKLNSVWVAFNPPGFAFVEFENRDDAEKACDIMNGSEVLGSQLRVEISKGRPRQGRRGGGGRDFGRRQVSNFGGGGRSSSGGFRPSRGSGSRYNQDSYNAGSRRNYSGGRDSGFEINRRDGYGSNRDAGRSYSGGFGSGGRSGGNQSGGGRFRSRSPVGNRRF